MCVDASGEKSRRQLRYRDREARKKIKLLLPAQLKNTVDPPVPTQFLRVKKARPGTHAIRPYFIVWKTKLHPSSPLVLHPVLLFIRSQKTQED